MPLSPSNAVSKISIHALRKESDYHNTNQAISQIISIHALRKESDIFANTCIVPVAYFNPRSP